MSLNKREKMLITLLLVVGIGVLYINYLIFPLYDQLMANRQTLSQRQAVLDELQQLSIGDNLANEETRVDELVSQMDEQIPNDTMLPLLYLDILKLVQDSGSVLEGVDFNVPSKEDDPGYEGLFLNNIQFRINLMGDYGSLDRFIGSVYENTRKMDVVWISYERSEDSLRSNVNLKAYAFLRDGENFTSYTDYEFIEGKPFGRPDPFTTGGQAQQTEPDDEEE
ncbi:hypothetical protein [Alkalibacter saccharofermentans]|uniref:Tfp pilus assembly protein PilO n=1 Tax=Alkalibacter saccharofermentans DSM 14828 TaxID=1120975 RepID=A0A1M4S8Y9_9FIRM|nr:hypothetical protein [Alkalibacter saccharofermentans]SHE28625.1 Tfp pilus assembly protein PilO [Alkalibacter saccharofermentans DSM 14828]